MSERPAEFQEVYLDGIGDPNARKPSREAGNPERQRAREGAIAITQGLGDLTRLDAAPLTARARRAADELTEALRASRRLGRELNAYNRELSRRGLSGFHPRKD